MDTFSYNKKGFLLAEETLKVIIAIICILFLAYLLIALYNSYTADKKIEQAKTDLSRMETIISSLGEGQKASQDFSDPEGWHLYSFSGSEKPNSCLNTNCLCICQKSLIRRITSQATKCDNRGTCLVVPNLAGAAIDLKISGPGNELFIDIMKQSNRILIEEQR